MKYRSRPPLLCVALATALLVASGTAVAENQRSTRRPVAFVRRLTLIDAATKGPVSELRDGMTIRLADVPEDRLDILAETYPRRVDSVSFKLVEHGTAHNDMELPFTLSGGKGGKQSWRVKPGLLTLIVQPVQSGSPGIPLRMKVNFLGGKAEAASPAKAEPIKPTPAPLAETTAEVGRARLAEPAPAPAGEVSDQCRAMLRPDEGRMTVVCSHTLENADNAQLILKGGYSEAASGPSEPLCQFENATSPIVTSCAYLDNQLERLEVRVRAGAGKERRIPVTLD